MGRSLKSRASLRRHGRIAPQSLRAASSWQTPFTDEDAPGSVAGRAHRFGIRAEVVYVERPRLGFCRICDNATVACCGRVIDTEHAFNLARRHSVLSQLRDGLAPLGCRELEIAAEPVLHPLARC